MAYAAYFNIIPARSSDQISKTADITHRRSRHGITRPTAQKAYEKKQRDHDADRQRSAKRPPCSPPLGRPRSDTAFAQGEAVPSSNIPEHRAILITQTLGSPDVGLTLQTSLIYNHIFINSKRTNNEQTVTSTKLGALRQATERTFYLFPVKFLTFESKRATI
ncbi:MAG: hypothetical protein IIX15_01735 [Clostridia bacterium]|nr:hypothetical protein [Clostridia bacterium]